MSILPAIGVDIVKVDRIEKAMSNKSEFAEKVLTKKEFEYCSSKKNNIIHIAGRFAAKEAIYKALCRISSKKFFWKDIEVLNDKKGLPFISEDCRLSGFLLKDGLQCQISISHEEDYAVSNAIITKVN